MTDREMGRDIGRDGDWSDTLARRLYEQRVVLLRGPLNDMTATRVAAELMTLDAEGDEAISLRIDCGDGTLALALTLMDVIELSGVPVRALCMGQVGGPALGPLAVCQHRAAMPSTRFSLREPATQLEASAREVSQWVELRADERRRFCARLATAVGRPEGRGGRRPGRRQVHGRRRGSGLRVDRRGLPTRCGDPAAAEPADRISSSPLTVDVPTMRP